MKRSRLKNRTPLKAKNPLPRGPGPERKSELSRSGKPMSKRNAKRRAKEWARAYGSPERVEWIKQQPSVVSGRSPCENAHVPDPEGPSGMGRKADARWIVPLTTAEHQRLHDHGIETFEATHGIDLIAEARKTEARWSRSPHNPENAG